MAVHAWFCNDARGNPGGMRTLRPAPASGRLLADRFNLASGALVALRSFRPVGRGEAPDQTWKACNRTGPAAARKGRVSESRDHPPLAIPTPRKILWPAYRRRGTRSSSHFHRCHQTANPTTRIRMRRRTSLPKRRLCFSSWDSEFEVRFPPFQNRRASAMLDRI